MKRWLMSGALAAVLPFTLLACEDDEDAGDQIGDAIDEASEAAGDAGDSIDDVLPVTVDLEEQDNSGVSGDAVVTPEGNDRSRVSFNLSTDRDGDYEAGIWEGGCDGVSGAPSADLGAVDDGASTGTADIGITELKDGDYVVAVRGGTSVVACGEI